MKLLPILLPALLATQSPAQDVEIRGRMICEVTGSRMVYGQDETSETRVGHQKDLQPGMSLQFEYALDEPKGLSIWLGEQGDRAGLIDAQFPPSAFAGISRFTNIAEFRATYSELSFGQFGMNYKGSDQLFLKNQCGSAGWSGHFVRTHVAGNVVTVASLACQPFVDAIDAVFGGLSILR